MTLLIALLLLELTGNLTLWPIVATCCLWIVHLFTK